MPIELNQPFPSFSAPSQDGETANLAEYQGDNKLIVFYPKATTRGRVRSAAL